MVIYKLFGLIDQVLYGFAATLYSLIFDIAGLRLFGDTFNDMTKRIYTVIATVMVFKILISCVTYMLTPDKILGKDEGVPSLFKNIIISIGLLLLTPTIFDVAMDAQTEVADLVPQFILGVDQVTVADRDSMGESVALLVLKSFVSVRSQFNGTVSTDAINSISNFSTEITNNCGDAVKKLFDSSDCYYDYRILVSGIAGGFMCYTLIGMTLDIAVRSIKLSLLELLAPIPITSYIDKKTKKTFDEWLKKCRNIYVDLFIRLGALYLVLYLWIKLFGNNRQGIEAIITDSGVPRGSFKEGLLVIFVVLGALTFLKEAPKFLSSVLGLGEGSSLKGMFTPFWKKGAFGAIGGMAAGAVMNAVGGYKESLGKNKGVGARLKAAAAGAYQGARGALSAGFHGAVATAQGKNGAEVWKAGYGRSTTARHNRYLDRVDRQTAGVSRTEAAVERARVRILDSAHISTDVGARKDEEKAIEDSRKAIKNVKGAITDAIHGKESDTVVTARGRDASGKQKLDAYQKIEGAMTVDKYLSLQGLDTGNVYHQLHNSFNGHLQATDMSGVAVDEKIAKKANGELAIARNADGSYAVTTEDASGHRAIRRFRADEIERGLSFEYDRQNHFLRYNDLTAMKEAQSSTGINVNIDETLGTADKVFVQEVMSGRHLYKDGTDLSIRGAHDEDTAVKRVIIGTNDTEDSLRTAYNAAQETLRTASNSISQASLSAEKPGIVDIAHALDIPSTPYADPTKERYGDVDSALQRRSAKLSSTSRESAEQVARNAMNRKKDEKK